MRTYASLAEALGAQDPRWERPFVCPSHDDHNASASVNIKKMLWYCYACGAKGSSKNVDYEEALDLRFIDEQLAEPTVLSERYLEIYTAGVVHPYWLTRFTEDSCRHFQLGYDPVSHRPCYPVRSPEGEFLGITTRNLEDEGPKYRYPKGVKTNRMLWNYSPEEREVVYLVEGAMDVIAAWEAGYTAFGIYGSHLSAWQIDLIKSVAPSTVCMVFDNDHAGRKAAAEAEVAMEHTNIQVTSVDWARWEQYGDDLAELPVEIRAKLLEEVAQHPTLL